MKLSYPSVPSSRCATKGSSAASEKPFAPSMRSVRTEAPRAATIRAARSASGSSASSRRQELGGYAAPLEIVGDQKIAGAPLGELGGAGGREASVVTRPARSSTASVLSRSAGATPRCESRCSSSAVV